MRHLLWSALTVTTLAVAGPALAQQAEPPKAAPSADAAQSTAPDGARSYFVNLKNGDTIASPFKVIFGLTPNMGVAPSGVDKKNVGHHHIIIDTVLSADELTQPITVDEKHIHFGKGQTETMLNLEPGKHTLQLVFGDWTHTPFKPGVQSEVITVNVKAQVAQKPVARPKPKEAKAMYRRHASHHRHAPHPTRWRLFGNASR